MHMYVTVLEKVARRYAPSRTLSFDVVHVFAALQMMWNTGRASRNALCSALCLGEATVKTLGKISKDARTCRDFKLWHEDD